MVSVSKLGLTVLAMKATGRITVLSDKVNLFISMVMSTRATG